MSHDSERARYWNETYYEYWKARVKEAKAGGGASGVVAGDALTEDDSVYEAVFRAFPFKPGRLLDVGCAWGRMVGQYRAMGLKVCGIDISHVMIEQARQLHGADDGVEDLQVAEAEHLPYENGSFDNVACLATFDATYQHEALGEFLRVLRMGGQLFLTGKGDHYHADDQIAYDAELGARRKQHPNYFTDVPRMERLLREAGHRIIGARYFERRGDFAANRYVSERPERFYEWLLVLEKGSEACTFSEFSDAYSRTYRERAEGA